MTGDGAGGEVVEEGAGDQDPVEPSRAQRRAVRSARVRRRRRIVAWTGAGILAVVALFALWYELESHALGPAGPQVVVTVHPGESTNAVAAALHQHGVIGSTLAFEIGDFFHGTPTVLPGSYAVHQNQTFGEVRAVLAAGPNIYPVDVRPGFTLSEVASEVDGLPAHAAGGFARAAQSGAVHSEFSPPGSSDLEGMLGTGIYDVLPHESDLALLRLMVDRFDHQARAAGLSTSSAAALGLSPYQVITVASIVEKEGYYPVNMPDVARVDLQPAGPRHAAADGLDRPVRARPGRRSGDGPGRAAALAVQHVPQHGPDPHAPSACRRRTRSGRRSTRRPAPGSTSCWCRRTA